MKYEAQTPQTSYLTSHISYLKTSIRPLNKSIQTKYYADTVSVLPVMVIVYFCNGKAAGPCTTAPVLLNSLPWAGQINIP